MLRPERMDEVTLVVKKQDANEAIAALASLKALHIKSHEPTKVGESTIGLGNPEESAKTLARSLTLTDQLLRDIDEDIGPLLHKTSVAETIERIDALAALYEEHESALTHIATERRALEERRSILEMLEGFDSPIETIFKARRIEVIVVPCQVDLGIPSQHNAIATILYPDRKDSARIKDALKEQGIETIDLSPLADTQGTQRAALHHLERDWRSLDHQERHEREGLRSFAKHGPFLHHARHQLAIELLKAQAPLRFGVTQRTVLIKGWLPSRRTPELRAALAMDHLIDIEHAEGDGTPTALRNPPIANSFEELIRLYTLPRYHEIDPTSLLAITFPLFFGFMLGDIGYGLALLIAFVTLYRMVPIARGYAKLLMLSALSSIAFGIFFGEFFGLEHIGPIELHPILHRVTQVDTMFVIALIIGLIHINLGLLLGIYNLREHGWAHALAAKGSWILLEISIALLVMSSGMGPHVPGWVAWSSLAISLALLFYGEGARGLAELPTLFSHTGSYLRLVAVGLASVVLAIVTNDLGRTIFALGGIWVVAAVVLVIFGHAINLALGLMGPFLHSLRLHYVEFFMKFYEGGGQRYEPFGEVNYG